jgi:O-antigen/teichoic acid export membrane protein
LEQNLKEKTAKGLFWGGISNGVQQLVGAAFGIAIARILSPGDYGLVGMLAIFIAIANTILDSGFSTALVNKKEIKHEDYNAVFWFSLITGVFMYVLLFFAAPLIARFYGNPALTNLARVLFLSFLVGGSAVVPHVVLYKNLMLKERAKVDIIAVLTSGSLGLLLAVNGFSYWGIAIQTVTFVVVGTVLRWRCAKWKPTTKINFKPLKEMIGFSSNLFFTNIFAQISGNIFSVLLGKFYDVQKVGYYTQGNKWMGYGCTAIVGMVYGVAQPVFVECRDDQQRLLAVFRKMLRFGAFVSFPSMLGLAFIGEEFVLITVGEKWFGSVPFLQLLCLWGAVMYLWSLYTFLIITFGKSDIYLGVNVIVYILQLACILLFFPLGIMPMVAAYVGSTFIGIAVWHHFANKFIRIRWWHVLQDVLPYLGITIGCLGVAWIAATGVENVYLRGAVKIAVAGGLYLMVMKYSKSIIFRESMDFVAKKVKNNWKIGNKNNSN